MGAIVVGASWLALRAIPAGLALVREFSATTDQQIELLNRANARLSRVPALSDSLALLSQVADSLPSMLLSGEDVEAAEVDLMARVRALATDRPVRVQGFASATVDQDSGRLALAAVVVDLETDFRGLLGFLEGVERESRALAVEALRVTALDPDGEASAIEFLMASVTVSGWFQRDSPEYARFPTEAPE